MTVEPDGVSLALDPARSDLLVDAELARFADLASPEPARAGAGAVPRFAVTAASLRRARPGSSPPQLADWFTKRTGANPPRRGLLLAATTTEIPPLLATRMLVLTLPSARVLDGLLQHPATSPLLGTRLGPTAVAIPDDQLAPLRKALQELGIRFEMA